MDWINHNRNMIITLAIIVLVVAVLMNGMSLPTAVSVLLSGVTLAALYFLVASGISIIFGLMDVLNFAHGSIFMIGAYAGWTFYTNPRLIFNTVPLFLALAAAASLGPLWARRVTLPTAARWITAAVAAGIVVLGARDFPLDKLVAMGTTMTGRIIATPEAEEPLAAMVTRMGLFFAAGLVLTFALGSGNRDRLLPSRSRIIGTVAVLALLGVALLIGRDTGEQLILNTESNVRFLLALAFGAIIGGLLGALMEWGLVRPLYSRPIYQILLTMGLVFVADQLIRLVWGPAGAFMDIPTLFSSKSAACPSDNLLAWLGEHCDSVMIAGRAFPSYRLFIIGVGIIMIVAIMLLLQRSRLGMIIRAGVQDSEMVEALGINVRRVFTLVFAIGAALAGLGGVVAAPFLGVYPGMAMEFLLQAFIVVVIGGLGSIPGAAIGALLVGLARAYGDHIVLSGIQLPGMSEALSGSPAIARASTVLIMAIVLFIKPTGIFGTKE